RARQTVTEVNDLIDAKVFEMSHNSFKRGQIAVNIRNYRDSHHTPFSAEKPKPCLHIANLGVIRMQYPASSKPSQAGLPLNKRRSDQKKTITALVRLLNSCK